MFSFKDMTRCWCKTAKFSYTNGISSPLINGAPVFWQRYLMSEN